MHEKITTLGEMARFRFPKRDGADVRLPNDDQKEQTRMTGKLTEKARRTGLESAVDHCNPTQDAPIAAEVANEVPDESWSFERLMNAATSAVVDAERLSTEATCLVHKSSVQIYRAGRVLNLARKKVPKGQTWERCLKSHGIPKTSAWEAMQLYERAPSEEAIASLTPAEAKVKYGVTKKKSVIFPKSKAKPPRRTKVVSEPEPTHPGSGDGEDDEDELEASSPDSADDDGIDRADDLDDDHEELVGLQSTPFDVVSKIVQQLEYLEEMLTETMLESDHEEDVFGKLDEAAEVIGRIRRSVAAP
jgi:hypothetical protein